jgi:bacillithiol biosynthesis deacetylase BshB1
MNETVDILAIGAHPDDVELSCSGTLIKEVEKGRSVALVDLTRGELGTRGSGELRLKEAAAAAEVIGAQDRVNLDLGDGWFENNQENKIKIIEQIRRFRPKVVLMNAVEDRHIDHGRASTLASEAVFLSGLRKIETQWNGEEQEAYRPPTMLHYIQYFYLKPDVVVDISEAFPKKLEAIKAFKSQFFDPDSNEPESVISTKKFWHVIESRAREMGSIIQCEYAEGFNVVRPIGVETVMELV